MAFDRLKAHELREGDVIVEDGAVIATVSDVRQTTDDDGAPEVTATLTGAEDGKVQDATWAADADLGPSYVRGSEWEGALDEAALKVRAEQAMAEELAAQAERDAAAEAAPTEEGE